MPPAKTVHGERSGLIHSALLLFARTHRLGRATAEGGYLLARDPDTIQAPDAAFLSYERLAAAVRLPEDAYFEGAPNLAVEVVSDTDREADVAAKVAGWLNAGADRVWEVRPRTRTVTIHHPRVAPRTLGDGDTQTSGDAAFSVEGFALPVDTIFD